MPDKWNIDFFLISHTIQFTRNLLLNNTLNNFDYKWTKRTNHNNNEEKKYNNSHKIGYLVDCGLQRGRKKSLNKYNFVCHSS